MSVRQFTNSLRIIQRTENSNRGVALARHLFWQARKLAFPRPVQLRISSSQIMDDEPGGVISLVNMFGRYDFNNMHFVQRVLARVPDFIDVGANIGAYTLIASEVPTAKVVSLEPVPAAYAKLQRNLVLNGRRNVVALNLGASRQPGTLRMTCDGSSPINHVVAPGTGDPAGDPASGATTISVPVDTLDEICRRMGVSRSLVKIDVEGHEPEVLAGAVECLASCDACLVENGDRDVVVAFMRDNGMSGPYYYRHRASTLRRAAQKLPEDQIFVGRRFAQTFPEIEVEA